jgi:hypothetical protein
MRHLSSWLCRTATPGNHDRQIMVIVAVTVGDSASVENQRVV